MADLEDVNEVDVIAFRIAFAKRRDKLSVSLYCIVSRSILKCSGIHPTT